MDVEEYVVARRWRLIELAIELGLPAATSERVVDQVIMEQRRKIARAEDPDEVVVPALREKIAGGRPRHRWRWVAALVAVVFIVAVAILVRDPNPHRVPSLFGLTSGEAQLALRNAGINMTVVSVPQCDPAGQVLGSIPPVGSMVAPDEFVTVIAASRPDSTCPRDAAARARAWKFLRFFISGTARPNFAPGVRLFVNGAQVTVVDGGESASAPGWRAAGRDAVVSYLSGRTANVLGQPLVHVSRGVPPLTTCGHPRVTPAGAVLPSTRVTLSTGRDSSSRCELTIDLFDNPLRDISSVAIYTP